MPLLLRYDPPAFLSDFNSIPGQLDAWHKAVSSWFNDVVNVEQQLIKQGPQFYNAASFDPGGIAVEQAVTWNAFPKELLRRYGRDRALELADMLFPIERYGNLTADPLLPLGKLGVVYRPQEEYCEWHVLRDPDTHKIKRITFTSEPPEYWQALFGVIPGDKANVAFPGDRELLLQLYRELVSSEVQLEDLIGTENVSSPLRQLIAKGQYNIYNKWNTTRGIAHLNAPPNSLTAEIRLGGDATVLYTDPDGRLLVEPDALITRAAYGGPNRNSDPTIGSTVNALARLGAYVTLRNPVGLYMDHIDLSGWSAPDGSDVSEFVRIVRGTPGMIERLVVEKPKGHQLEVGDLSIAGVPVRYGGQVAECITVKLVGLANLVSPAVIRKPVRTTHRSGIDPNFPRLVTRATAINDQLPAGTVEAYSGEGVVPRSGPSAPKVGKKAWSIAATAKRPLRPLHRYR